MDRFEFGMVIGIQERKGWQLIFSVGVCSDISVLEMALAYRVQLGILKIVLNARLKHFIPSRMN